MDMKNRLKRLTLFFLAFIIFKIIRNLIFLDHKTLFLGLFAEGDLTYCILAIIALIIIYTVYYVIQKLVSYEGEEKKK